MRTSLLALVAIILAGSTADAGIFPVVNTLSGPVRGADLDTRVRFLGIPYAAPPVGKLRWAAPAPPEAWTEPRNALAFGSACPQAEHVGVMTYYTGSEDCLTLNVWAPKNGRPLPVMVFIHGGGNSLGTSGQKIGVIPVYDGGELAVKGHVVVVSLNYRLGVLGFLAHKALSAESGYGASGNYGLMDQIQALQWVKANIGSFGGDPANVTVFGESAGGIDIYALLTSPRARGLFQKAIVESGLLTDQSLAESEAAGAELSGKLECEGRADEAACLRSRSADEIVRLTESQLQLAPTYLTVDHHVLNSSVLSAFHSGNYAKEVPVLLGTNADEMANLLPFVMDVNLTLTSSGYQSRVRRQFGAQADLVLKKYPATGWGTPYGALAALEGDVYLQCPNRNVARALVAGGTPVWKYLFTHVSDNPVFAPLRAGHALELPYVFGNLLYASPRERGLSAQIIETWSAFARTGDPNAGVLPDWPRFTGQELMRLDIHSQPDLGFRDDFCDLIDELAKR